MTTGPPLQRLSPEKRAVARQNSAKAEFSAMEEMGIIRRSNSPWSSPLHVVPKANGGWRPCIDYRRLNEITTPDRYPVPHIQDFMSGLAGAKIFSTVDFVRGYHQIPLQDIQKTAIIISFGLYKFLRMPFGLKKKRHKLSRDSWIQSAAASNSSSYTSTTFLLQAKLRPNTYCIYENCSHV